MRKKFKILIFSKMAPTILIKFCGFIVHSKPNIMTLSAFPGKIPETRKIAILIFCPSPNVAPKPTSQSRSHSISRVLLQISPADFFIFPLPLKLRVVHMRKKLNILIFSKMAPTILIKFCEFIGHSKPNIMTLSAFPGNVPETAKIVFNFLFVTKHST